MVASRKCCYYALRLFHLVKNTIDVTLRKYILGEYCLKCLMKVYQDLMWLKASANLFRNNFPYCAEDSR